ncbi:MAG: exodeoxyribonuclease VII large subunit [Lachnospiraceae bacterium]|jgi:exodeoxyribonuclease VII large subunit|nr:exodeoxyribonuclease VII large subunit [Lachnospiraceae bacterium]
MAQSVYTVKQVNSYIKNMFTQDFMLSRIYVKGEASNVKYHTSGHVYFSLKDESGTIACMLFAGQRAGLVFRLEEGQQIVVLGSVNIYEKAGSYRLYAKEIRLDGEGRLYEAFQALKKELEEMGMFAQEYKRKIPGFSSRIGIVTAPTGAAIQDIVNISKRRNPYVQLILYPAKVQGAGAKESIVKGIEVLSKLRPDVIIAGRGGGSIEDLWAFNEREVADAIFNCPIPVISAVGHETDWTIADFVADLRAPTPSAAAELAVCDVRALLLSLQNEKSKLNRALNDKIRIARMQSEGTRRRLTYMHPRNKLRQKQQNLIDVEDDLRRIVKLALSKARNKFNIDVERMKGLSPLNKLEKGFAYVSDEIGKNIKSIRQVEIGENLKITVLDGNIIANITGKEPIIYD